VLSLRMRCSTMASVRATATRARAVPRCQQRPDARRHYDVAGGQLLDVIAKWLEKACQA
jgi:hypothetical protein